MLNIIIPSIQPQLAFSDCLITSFPYYAYWRLRHFPQRLLHLTRTKLDLKFKHYFSFSQDIESDHQILNREIVKEELQITWKTC